MTVSRILILGGYGNFGKRIATSLSDIQGITIIIAGRNARKAQMLCEDLSSQKFKSRHEAALIDIYSTDFTKQLRALSPDIVIHTGGPFQGQNYRVPEAAISIGSHYIDLADDRRFVCDITSLNTKAVANGVLVVSGASSVPGLSSTVVDHFYEQFSKLDEIDFAIAPGNKAEVGEATLRGILSYTGHPFSVFKNNKWVKEYGWMSPRKISFGKTLGKRWLANIDIPDLELFPVRYPSLRTVWFQAGVELPLLHFTMVFMAFIARFHIVKDWSVITKQIFKSNRLFKNFGTNDGGMQISLTGTDNNQQTKEITWTLCAENGVGPYIPTISAIILTKKIIDGSLTTTGATPCLGLYTLAEFDKESASLDISHRTLVN